MANRYAMTPQKKGKFLKMLAETADVSRSSKYAGVSRNTPYEERKRDPEFASAWEEALNTAIDALEAEARRRALNGVEEPQFYKGEVCGHVRRYSDNLLMFILKAHRPEKYRERVEHSGKIESAPVVNLSIMPASKPAIEAGSGDPVDDDGASA